MSQAQLKKKVKIRWTSNFAYAIGLITSDGCLKSDGRHILFCSKDLALIQNFKNALMIDNKISKYARGGETIKKYFKIEFGDKNFYQFLNSIGITQAKSKTTKAVKVPDNLFGDFLRGLFDGDGTFYTSWDKRWPKSFVFKTAFASASIDFIKWLKKRLTELLGVKGTIHKGAGVYNLEYVKGDSRIIAAKMYRGKDLLFLNRKYYKIQDAFKKDEKFGLIYLQKHQNAGLAQR